MKVTCLPGGSHPRAQPSICWLFDLLRISVSFFLSTFLFLQRFSEPSYTKQLLSH